MKRQLIFEDKELLAQMLDDLKGFRPHLNKMQTAFERLEIGEFSEQIMQTIKTKGTNPIEIDFNEALAQQLDKSGITSKAIRENLLKNSNEVFIKFKQAVNDARSYTPRVYSLEQRPTLDFAMITYNNNTRTFFVDEKAKEDIKDNYCRVYLQTEAEKTLYEALNGLLEAQKNVRTLLERAQFSFNVREGYENNEINTVFFADGKVKPRSINSALTQWQRLENVKKLSRANR